jgi:hypothetical protein
MDMVFFSWVQFLTIILQNADVLPARLDSGKPDLLDSCRASQKELSDLQWPCGFIASWVEGRTWPVYPSVQGTETSIP